MLSSRYRILFSSSRRGRPRFRRAESGSRHSGIARSAQPRTRTRSRRSAVVSASTSELTWRSCCTPCGGRNCGMISTSAEHRAATLRASAPAPRARVEMQGVAARGRPREGRRCRRLRRRDPRLAPSDAAGDDPRYDECQRDGRATPNTSPLCLSCATERHGAGDDGKSRDGRLERKGVQIRKRSGQSMAATEHRLCCSLVRGRQSCRSSGVCQKRSHGSMALADQTSRHAASKGTDASLKRL